MVDRFVKDYQEMDVKDEPNDGSATATLNTSNVECRLCDKPQYFRYPFLVSSFFKKRQRAAAAVAPLSRSARSDIPKGLLESQEFGTLSIAFTFVYNVSKIVENRYYYEEERESYSKLIVFRVSANLCLAYFVPLSSAYASPAKILLS